MIIKGLGDQDIQSAIDGYVEKAMEKQGQSGFNFPSMADIFGIDTVNPILKYRGLFSKSEEPHHVALSSKAVEDARRSNAFQQRMLGMISTAIPFFGPLWGINSQVPNIRRSVKNKDVVKPYKATMYHGTVMGSGKLKPSIRGESGPGIYLSTSEDSAKRWADLKANWKPDSGQKVLSYDVKLNKPFDAYFNVSDRPNLTHVVAEKLGLETKINKYGRLELSGYSSPTEALKDFGYDGIIRRAGDNSIYEAVAFESKSLKQK